VVAEGTWAVAARFPWQGWWPSALAEEEGQVSQAGLERPALEDFQSLVALEVQVIPTDP